jgi:hypothetical protein
MQHHRAPTEMLWVPGRFSQRLLVLGRLAQSLHRLMLVFLLQLGTSYLFLMVPCPRTLGGCVLAEIQGNWATGLHFLDLPFQVSKNSHWHTYLMSFIMDLIRSGV